MTDAYLIDTCAMIWATNLAPLTGEAVAVMTERDAKLNVSAMSAWEVGMLVSKGRLPATKGALEWFLDFVAQAAVNVLDVTPTLLVASSYLPQPIHNDPTDRILIATAREHDLTIITRDRAILAYGAAGHVRTLAC
jgi:PIN domain nuclease of toxin-antitoxin system